MTHLVDLNHLLRDAQAHLSCPAPPADSAENGGCLLASAKDKGELKWSRDKCKALMEKCARVPRKGELDLIAGGPPCQGFSKMNRFPKSDNSQRKVRPSQPPALRRREGSDG